MPPSPLPLRLPADPKAGAAAWLARRRGGDMSATEQQDFLRWMNADDANRVAYDEAERLWQQMEGLEAVADKQLAAARAYLTHARRRPVRRRALAFAAASSVVALLAWSAGWLDLADEHAYRTALGERQTVELADGSRLELDTNTELVVRFTRRAREVELLRGQAAFTVAHDDARPFDVLADNGRIRDIGTQFDVRRQGGRVAVAVLEGAVEVAGADGTLARPLRQGERLSYSAQGEFSVVEPVDVASVAAWRQGRLVFRGQPLGEVLAELGRYHAASLTVTSSRLMSIKVSGVFPTDDLEAALTTIAATLPVKLTRTGAQSWRLDG